MPNIPREPTWETIKRALDQGFEARQARIEDLYHFENRPRGESQIKIVRVPEPEEPHYAGLEALVQAQAADRIWHNHTKEDRMDEFKISITEGTVKKWHIAISDPSGTQGEFIEDDSREAGIARLISRIGLVPAEAKVTIVPMEARITLEDRTIGNCAIKASEPKPRVATDISDMLDLVHEAMRNKDFIRIDYESPLTGKFSQDRRVRPKYQSPDGSGFFAEDLDGTSVEGNIRQFKYDGLLRVELV